MAAVAVMSGALVTGGALAGGAAASADVGTKMYIEYGPFGSYEVCEIDRILHDKPTTPCTLMWDRRHPLGFYYGEYS
jgi:hypothetical protein